MFASPAQFDPSTLLQGDILVDVQILGAMNYGSIHHHTPVTGTGAPGGWTVAAKPAVGDAIVLSHSCEVARENAVKVTSIILAPLRDVNSATQADRLQELIDSNLIDVTNPQMTYLKYFYIEPAAQLSYARGCVADYSKCFSVRKNSYDYLLGKKRLQLLDGTRSSLSLKLALYFHRRFEPRVA